jgi:hypothetical protein
MFQSQQVKKFVRPHHKQEKLVLVASAKHPSYAGSENRNIKIQAGANERLCLKSKKSWEH